MVYLTDGGGGVALAERPAPKNQAYQGVQRQVTPIRPNNGR